MIKEIHVCREFRYLDCAACPPGECEEQICIECGVDKWNG